MRRRKKSLAFTVGAGLFEAIAVAGIFWVAQPTHMNSETTQRNEQHVAARLEQSADTLQRAFLGHVSKLFAPTQ